MAKIPMGNFGNAMPQVQRIQMPQDQSGQMIAGALQNIGNTAGQISQQRDEQQRHQEVSAKNLELYNNQLQAKEGQLKLDETLTGDFSDKVSEIKNRVGNGEINAKQADEELNTWSSERFNQLKPIYRDTLSKIYNAIGIPTSIVSDPLLCRYNFEPMSKKGRSWVSVILMYQPE